MVAAHLLLDADGVVQSVAGGWRPTLEAHLGDRVDPFVRDLAALEMPLVTSGEDILPGLARLLRRYGVGAPPEDVYGSVWQRIEVDGAVVDLVRELRATGVGVHLVTNQHARRAAYMRAALGYDDLFDRCFYSCELGVAKPDPAYFRLVLAALAAAPARTLFVDDHAPHVAAARELGLSAETWTLREGIGRLRELLAGHGLPC